MNSKSGMRSMRKSQKLKLSIVPKLCEFFLKGIEVILIFDKTWEIDFCCKEEFSFENEK